MKKMLFEVCAVMICSLFLFSCEKDKAEELVGSMAYYEQIENKEGIEIESLEGVNRYGIADESPSQWAKGDTTVLWGFRNNRVWIGLFDKQTKKQLIEWTSDKSVNRDITIDKGYGEFEKAHIDRFDLYGMKYTPFGFICNPIYHEGGVMDWILINGNNMFLYSKTIENKRYRASRYKIWYKNSIILGMYLGQAPPYIDEYIAVVSPETGKNICILQDYRVFEDYSPFKGSEVHPLSYTDGLYLSQVDNDVYIIRENYETGKEVWKTPITRLKDIKSDARKTVTVLNKDDKQWTFQFDIVNYDGSKQQVKLSVDVATGEIKYI